MPLLRGHPRVGQAHDARTDDADRQLTRHENVTPLRVPLYRPRVADHRIPM